MIDALRSSIDNLITQNKDLGGDTVHEKAEHMRDHLIPAMNQVRHDADDLERVTPHDLWALPTYREILFVK